jgi:site-specific recombinase XerD
VLKHLQIFDQRGDRRIRYRRRGFKRVDLPVPKGYKGREADPTDSGLINSREFMAAYLAAGSQPLAELKAGEKRAAHGTVEWLCVEYLASPAYTRRPKSMRDRHKRYIEDFRKRRGTHMVAVFEREHLERMFAKMLDQPSKANQWLSAMRDLFDYAIDRKLINHNPADKIEREKAKPHVLEDGTSEEGHLTWPLSIVAAARKAFAVGTKMRLTVELINALALRRSDVRRVGPLMTYAGVLEDGRPATFLKYTQWKNRGRKPVTVDTPIPADVLAVIKATPTVGLKTWLVNGRGKPFTDQGFTDWFSAEWAKAGLPAEYTPHGLRKRCLTDLAERGMTPHQMQSISGHLTLKELERYTRMADRARAAQAVMAGRV